MNPHRPSFEKSSPHFFPATRAPILAAGLLFALVSFCGAQSDPSTPFRAISWADPIEEMAVLAADGKTTPVEIPLGAFSRHYAYEGPGPVIFGTGTGAANFKKVAAVSVPEPGAGGTLWILFNNLDTDGQYATSSVQEIESDLKPGGYRFFNFSDFPLHIKCGNVEAAAPARKSATIYPDPTDSKEIMPVEVSAEQPEGLKRVYANRWPYGKAARTLVIAYFDPALQGFEFKRITTDPRPAAAERK